MNRKKNFGEMKRENKRAPQHMYDTIYTTTVHILTTFDTSDMTSKMKHRSVIWP